MTDKGHYQVIDDFLPPEVFQEVSSTLMGTQFPWRYNPYVTSHDEESTDLRMYQFIHLFVGEGQVASEFLPLAISIGKQAGMAGIWRCKANLNTYTGEARVGEYHIDYDLPPHFRTAIFYVNSNNGYTEFESGGKVESVANRLCTFDLNERHRGVTQTDVKSRVVLNFVYLP